MVACEDNEGALIEAALAECAEEGPELTVEEVHAQEIVAVAGVERIAEPCGEVVGHAALGVRMVHREGGHFHVERFREGAGHLGRTPEDNRIAVLALLGEFVDESAETVGLVSGAMRPHDSVLAYDFD